MRVKPGAFLKSSGSNAERVLALLCASKDPRKIIRRVLASWKGLSRQELLESIDRLKTLAQLRGNDIIAKEELERMPFDLDITQGVFYKEAEELANKNVMKRGLRQVRQGVLQGRKQGEATATARILTLLLEQRFGPVSAKTRERMTQATTSQLETWALRAPKARRLTDVFAD